MKRNLIFYCYLRDGEIDECTQLNIVLLKKYANMFNGDVIIKVAFDDINIDNEKELWVRSSFSFFNNPSIEIVKNNPETRESEYFIESIEEITDDNSLTFFCHNKGNTHTSPDIRNNIFNWIFSMYFFNLDETIFKSIEKPLSNELMFSGILRKTLDCSPWVCSPWHYSGTFFWFNTKRLKENASWDNFVKGRFSVEAYPGQQANVEDSVSTFISANVDFNVLFDSTFWTQVLTKDVLGEEILERYTNGILFATSKN